MAFSGISTDTGASLEAQIANVADELAYNAHDLDDGLQAGLIRTEQLSDLDIWQQVVARIDWDGRVLEEVTRHHIIRELVGLQVDDVLQQSAENLECLQPDTTLDVQNHPQPAVCHSAGQHELNRALKDFLFENMYRHFKIVRMQARAENILRTLFTSYMNEPRQLPDQYKAKLNSEPVQRVVADYVAGLTDRSALHEFRQFFDRGTRP